MKLIRYLTDFSFSSRSFVFCKTFVLMATLAIVLCTGMNVSNAADNDIGTQSLPANDKSAQFEYQLENRADPFVPFITEKAAVSSVNMDDILDNNEPLTGMQLFEPGQLTLVALIKKGAENMAMVQDFTGKGYVLTEGIKIGRRGVVKNFTPQSIIIEETSVTRAGKKTVNEVIMQLKKEGEK
jgi:Tfp pilus assembly protein PilP